MSLHDLPHFTFYQIYDNLDNSAIKNLAHTCKCYNDFFKKLKNNDDNIKKIVSFVFDNYLIAESSFESVDLKKYFSAIGV